MSSCAVPLDHMELMLMVLAEMLVVLYSSVQLDLLQLTINNWYLGSIGVCECLYVCLCVKHFYLLSINEYLCGQSWCSLLCLSHCLSVCILAMLLSCHCHFALANKQQQKQHMTAKSVMFCRIHKHHHRTMSQCVSVLQLEYLEHLECI